MFYSSVWDPRYILYQIVAVQSLFYAQFGVTLLLLDQLAGHMLTIDQVFNYRLTNFHSHGWIVVISSFINSFLGAVSLLFIVERSKKCLDHAATVTIVHLVACSLYAGFPSTWSWWLVNLLSCVMMALVGEYICMRRELRDIPITTKGFGASPLSPPPQSLPLSPSKWKTSGEDFSSSGFGGMVGVGNIPLGDYVSVPVQPSSEENTPRVGSGEFTPRFGSGEFTPRFGSGLGFSSVYNNPPSPTINPSINISVG